MIYQDRNAMKEMLMVVVNLAYYLGAMDANRVRLYEVGIIDNAPTGELAELESQVDAIMDKFVGD
jgi:hypothetical protein